MYKISLRGVILILKYHNPLRRIDAWEIARILNQDNELRMRARKKQVKSIRIVRTLIEMLNCILVTGKYLIFTGTQSW